MMKNTMWLLLIAAVLVFGLIYWGNSLQKRFEDIQKKLQISEWCLREYRDINIRDQAELKHLKQQLEKK
jgi:hypothetical protein